MSQSRTFYHIILDRSGSMGDCIAPTISGVNEQIQHIRHLKQLHPEQEITMGLTLFNGDVDLAFSDRDPFQCSLLSNRTYVPDGNTALFDAVGYTLSKLENGQRRNENGVADTYVVIIVTDGHENSSRLYNFTDIRSMIQRLEATGNWTFCFLGATLDAEQVGESLSIARRNSMSFSKGSMKKEVWHNLSESMSFYMDQKKAGIVSKEFLKNK
jgi:hypothetical protein